MIRKSALDTVGLYDERLSICQDYDLWIRMARSFLLVNIPYIGLQYRAHGQSLSQKNIGRTKDEIMGIILRNINFLLPDLSVTDSQALLAMLIFDPLQQDERIVLALFDRYFNALMRASAVKADAAHIRVYQARIKALYVPQILKKNVLLGISSFIQALFTQPRSLFSKRFLACMWYSVNRKW